jgi:protein TonB
MNTHFYPTYGNEEKALSRSRILSFSVIVLAHLGLAYALQHGLISKVTQLLPREVVMTLIQPETPVPEQTKPQIVQSKKTLTPVTTEVMPPKTPIATPNNIPNEQAIVAAATEAPVASAKTEVTTQAPTGTPSPTAIKTVSAVEYIRAPKAEYPRVSRRMGEEGKVTLRVLVNEKGYAEKVDIQKSSGFQRLDEAARHALMQAIFKPYLEDGRALAMIATATINFSLDV